MSTPIILIILVALFVLIAVITIINNKKYNHKPKFKIFFIIGICWIPLGVATKNPVFSAVGLLFMILGLINKKKWKEEPKWSELPPEIRKMKLILILIISLIFLGGIVLYFLANKGVINV